MISGRIKEGLWSRDRELAASFPEPPSSLPGCLLNRVSFPPSLAKGTAARSLLGTHRPARGSGSRRPRGSWGRGEAGGPLRSPGAASFPQPGEAPVHPEAGYRLGPCRCLPAGSNPGTARLTHQGVEIPAKTRASELSILIEIAGLGTAGGRLYRFDFCCSGEHITTD